MKLHFDIDCTPEEARQFLGLPDVVPMQDALMKQLQAKLSENIRTLDPETLAKTWVPITMQNWSEMQKMFWNNLGSAGARGGMRSPGGMGAGSGGGAAPFKPDFETKPKPRKK